MNQGPTETVKPVIRSFLVAYDGPARYGMGTGDIVYNTGPEGMTFEHLTAIREYVKSPQGGGFDSVRISFFAELGV